MRRENYNNRTNRLVTTGLSSYSWEIDNLRDLEVSTVGHRGTCLTDIKTEPGLRRSTVVVNKMLTYRFPFYDRATIRTI